MNIVWQFSSSDVDRISEIVNEKDNVFIQHRKRKNIKREGLCINENSLIKAMIACLLTSQQRSGPNTPIGRFFSQKDFPLTYDVVENSSDIISLVRGIMMSHGLNRFTKRIPKFFKENYNFMKDKDWSIINKLSEELNGKQAKSSERIIADKIHEDFKGFGPKQSRNFLQTLGLTKYEIPIDSRITRWLNEFGFPFTLSSAALGDKGYYHFVLDGIQALCEEAKVYPCIFDAAIFSSYDNGEWTDANMYF